MLERAIASVAEQTFHDWEIVVSDDEAGAGETWSLLRRLRREVPNLRVFRNRLAAGQVGNTNNALLRARGAWLKLLHDDDRLYPECLETLVELAARHPDAACISCVYDRVTAAGRRPYRRRWRAELERIASAEAVAAIYLLEEGDWAQPSVTLVPRRAVAEAGILFEEVDGLRSAVDSWFYARLAAHGDLLILRRPLVEYHVGHDSVSARMSAQEFRDEIVALRQHMKSRIPEAQGLPPLAAIGGMVDVLQGLVRVRRGRLAEAARLFARVRHPQAFTLAAWWLLHLLSGGRHSRVLRQRLDPAGSVRRPTPPPAA